MSMYPRTNYEMTQEDLTALLESMKPVPMIMLQCGAQPSQQENANAAWATFGKKMGFDPMTVQPDGRGNRFFTAIPSETELQREERMAREQEDKQRARVAQLQQELAERQAELNKILGVEV